MTEQYNTFKDNMRKPLPCILIFLTVGVVTVGVVTNKRDCSKNEYWRDGLCCDKCAPGYKLIKTCSSGMQSECEKCSDGTYQDSMNYFPNCFRCKKCSKRHAVVISPCTYQNNTVCGCQLGYRMRVLDGFSDSSIVLSWDCVPLKVHCATFHVKNTCFLSYTCLKNCLMG